MTPYHKSLARQIAESDSRRLSTATGRRIRVEATRASNAEWCRTGHEFYTFERKRIARRPAVPSTLDYLTTPNNPG